MLSIYVFKNLSNHFNNISEFEIGVNIELL